MNGPYAFDGHGTTGPNGYVYGYDVSRQLNVAHAAGREEMKREIVALLKKKAEFWGIMLEGMTEEELDERSGYAELLRMTADSVEKLPENGAQ